MRTLYFCPVISSSSSIFFPHLISAIADWMSAMHTWCGLSANLGCRSETCCTRLAGNTGRKKLPSGHHCTTLSGYIFTNEACTGINNQKKNLLSSNISFRCPHNMVNFGPTSSWDWSGSLGTPANFNGFHILAALLHGTPVLGISQTLRHWTEGATYIRRDGHHVRHWPTF